MRKLNRNDKVLVMCLGVFVAMLGLSYASVPLYRMFCQVTGFAGTPRLNAEASSGVVDRVIEVRFDTNVAPGLPWEFRAKQGPMRVRLGETHQALFATRNFATATMSGTSTFNVTPTKAAQYFMKVQCFCTVNQKLKGRQNVDYTVAFYVDPAIATDPETKDVNSVTLSYTFFQTKSETNTAAAAAVALP